jgi:hypothetical protein
MAKAAVRACCTPTSVSEARFDGQTGSVHAREIRRERGAGTPSSATSNSHTLALQRAKNSGTGELGVEPSAALFVVSFGPTGGAAVTVPEAPSR